MNGLAADVVLEVGGEVVVSRANRIGLLRLGAIVLRFSVGVTIVDDGHCNVIMGPLQLSLLVMDAAV